MEHFVTIFNKNYLPQGLCLYDSLRKNYKNFTLWVISLDDQTNQILKSLKKENLKIVTTNFFETDELKKIKRDRTIAEYCWTLTPIAPKIIFDIEKKIERVTYVDADFFFLKNPKEAFEEFENSKKSILITEHDYDEDQRYKEKISGKYIVQFIIFKKNNCEFVRKWWEKKCIESCSSKITDEGVGDQKYLNDWHIKFKDEVHVLKKNYLFRSTWSYKKFNNDKISAWHFHGLKIIDKNLVYLAYIKNLPEEIFLNVYSPYLKNLQKNLDLINIKIDQKPQIKNLIKFLLYEIYYQAIKIKIIRNKKYFILKI